MATDAEPTPWGPTGHKCRWCDQGAVALDYPESPFDSDRPYKVPVCTRHARPAATPLPVGGCGADDCCIVCGAHLSDPHQPGCPLDQCAGCGVAVDETHYADCPEHGHDLGDEQPNEVGAAGRSGPDEGVVDECDVGRADAQHTEPSTDEPCPGSTGAQ